jgi:hypothetical protein
VLHAHLFESIAELRVLTGAWLRIYNAERPHDSLGRVPPLTFLPRPSSAESLLLNCPLDGGAYDCHPGWLDETVALLGDRTRSAWSSSTGMTNAENWFPCDDETHTATQAAPR